MANVICIKASSLSFPRRPLEITCRQVLAKGVDSDICIFRFDSFLQGSIKFFSLIIIGKIEQGSFFETLASWQMSYVLRNAAYLFPDGI